MLPGYTPMTVTEMTGDEQKVLMRMIVKTSDEMTSTFPINPYKS